jgi:hypothetical protein
MAPSRFQNNLRFALRKETSDARATIPFNRLEKIGDVLSWIAYELKAVFLKTLCDPRFITIFLTTFAMLFSTLLFYPSDTWRILSKICTWIFDHINWSYVRFSLWLLSEITILGIGMRAFGRFSNQKLLESYQVTE